MDDILELLAPYISDRLGNVFFQRHKLFYTTDFLSIRSDLGAAS